MKGVIWAIAPDTHIADLSHLVGPQNVRQAAWLLARSAPYFPQGTVHVVVVDPGVGTERRAIAVSLGPQRFVGPDNGLLSPAVAMVGGATKVVSLENQEARIPSPGESFHGRDVFAPAAALLASGEANLGDLGPVIPGDELMPLLLPLTETKGGAVTGEAWWVDAFGNVQTNISPEDLAAVDLTPGEVVTLKVGSRIHTLPWVRSYGDVAEGEALLHVDSAGLLALAVRGGRADEVLGIVEGVAVTLVGRTGSRAE
jgi:S-adenosylmethionine hydrolase